MDVDQATSRPTATALSLGALAPDAGRFHEKQVLLTGEPDILRTVNGQEIFECALRLLVRICSKLAVFVPEGVEVSFGARCRAVAQQIQFVSPVEFLNEPGNYEKYDAILSVGSQHRNGLPWTVVNSNGWLARVCSSSNDHRLCAHVEQSNPVASLAAASLGVAEVFKRLIALKPERGAMLPPTSFSLFTYQIDAEDPGPPIPTEMTAKLALFGVGAIGNGVVHLLKRLPLTGSIDLVDYQDFGPENLGTCFLIGPREIGSSKAKFAEEILISERMTAVGYRSRVADYAAQLDSTHPVPPVVINALDNVPARHEVQDLWPDLIIDGAIGPFECQVSCHPWEPNVACVRCMFEEPTSSSSLAAVRATGLSMERVQMPDSLVSESDVLAAPAGQKDTLRSQIGRRVCSVVHHAIAQRISSERLSDKFRPSVPFVATMSSSMAVAELVRQLAEWPAVLEPRFQFDMLVGPAAGQNLPELRHSDCICTTRRANIEKMRSRRVYR